MSPPTFSRHHNENDDDAVTIKLVFSIARAAAAAILAGAAGGLKNLPPLINPGGGSGKGGSIKGKRKLTGGIKTNALFALGLAEFDRRSGTSANEAYGRAFMNIGTNAFFQGLGGVLNRQGMPPLARALGFGFQIGGPFAGFGIQGGVFDPLMGIKPETTNQIINQSIDQIRTRQGDPDIEILPQVNTQDSAPMSVEGRAALLMFVEPFNRKNPYVLNSYAQYNVMPV